MQEHKVCACQPSAAVTAVCLSANSGRHEVMARGEKAIVSRFWLVPVLLCQLDVSWLTEKNEFNFKGLKRNCIL